MCLQLHPTCAPPVTHLCTTCSVVLSSPSSISSTEPSSVPTSRVYWSAHTCHNRVYWSAHTYHNKVYWSAHTCHNRVYWSATPIPHILTHDPHALHLTHPTHPTPYTPHTLHPAHYTLNTPHTPHTSPEHSRCGAALLGTRTPSAVCRAASGTWGSSCPPPPAPRGPPGGSWYRSRLPDQGCPPAAGLTVPA